MSRLLCRGLCLLSALAFLHPAASAQRSEHDRDSWVTTPGTVEVSGQVRFPDDAGPTPNVIVRLERFGLGGTLDQMTVDGRGRFRFANLPRGQYVVAVSARCFTAPPQQAELVLIFRSYLLFELKPDATSPGCAPKEKEEAGVVDARVPAAAREEFERGREALAASKQETGLAHLRKAVELYPDFFEAHLLVASVRARAGRWPEAEVALVRAAEISPRSVEALVSLGEVRRRQKKYAEAEEALASALKLDDAAWQGHLALGRVYLETDDVRRAAPHIGRTLQLKPDFAEAHIFAGNLLLKLNEPARALVEYEEYLRLAPGGEYAAQARDLTGKLRKSLSRKKD